MSAGMMSQFKEATQSTRATLQPWGCKKLLEKDKDDESLRKWKKQLLGSVDLSAVGGSKEPEVRVLSLTIVYQGQPDLVLPIPLTRKPKSSLFTLKEGCQYRIKFTFFVSKNIVSGLKYTNTVWKTDVRVDNSKRMLGTFSPQEEPYINETAEDTVPASIFARGWVSLHIAFVGLMEREKEIGSRVAVLEAKESKFESAMVVKGRELQGIVREVEEAKAERGAGTGRKQKQKRRNKSTLMGFTAGVHELVFKQQKKKKEEAYIPKLLMSVQILSARLKEIFSRMTQETQL
ncbi:hypothetical protein ACFX2I_003325 [Malus domestica]